MNANDHSLGSKLVLGLGALAVFGYSLATVGRLVYGTTTEAVIWVAVLLGGLFAVVVAATLTERAGRN